MASVFLNGLASGKAGYQVRRIEDDAALPETAEENTILVVTEEAISQHIFCSGTPEAPVEGMVWFMVGTKSSGRFNASEGGSAWVYPACCYQYIQGKWYPKEAYTYTDGWKHWSVWFYYKGDTYYSRTGGYAGGGETGKVTFSTNSMWIRTGNAAYYGAALTVNKIDMTDLDAIYVQIERNTAGNDSWAYISSTDSPDPDAGIASVPLRQTNAPMWYMLDVSKYSGEYYIAFLTQYGSVTTGVWVAQICGA